MGRGGRSDGKGEMGLNANRRDPMGGEEREGKRPDEMVWEGVGWGRYPTIIVGEQEFLLVLQERRQGSGAGVHVGSSDMHHGLPRACGSPGDGHRADHGGQGG